MNNEVYRSLDILLQRDSNKFWQRIKGRRKSRVHTSLTAEQFVNYYSGTMCDESTLTPEQTHIARQVDLKYNDICSNITPQVIPPELIDSIIPQLKRNSSPGIDGISAEYLLHGRSEILSDHLSRLFSAILTFNCVPSVFITGVMVPILKKPTIDPSNPSNYRPITVSSIFAKLFEMLIMPNEQNLPLCSNQYGFRNNYSVGHGISFLNDLMLYSRHTQSNMFICSMDAEKCFDSLWHAGLFYKLIDVLPDVHWCVLYNWYSSMKAVIKWNGNIHNMYFNVTRGTRQGSI